MVLSEHDLSPKSKSLKFERMRFLGCTKDKATVQSVDDKKEQLKADHLNEDIAFIIQGKDSEYACR